MDEVKQPLTFDNSTPPPPYQPSQQGNPSQPAPAHGQVPSAGQQQPGAWQGMPGQQPGVNVYGQQPMYMPPQQGVVYQQPGVPGHVTVVVAPGLANPPPDHLTYSILVTIFCCWPVGLFAILRSMACRDAINATDRERAARLSGEARKLANWALGIGIAFSVLVIGLVIAVYVVLIIPSQASGYY